MTDPADEVGQTTLPVTALPEYHGRIPVGMKTSVSGSSNRITRSHSIGDRAVLVSEVECVFAGHKKLDGKLFYIEQFTVLDQFEVQDAKAGSRLITVMRQMARTESDAGTRTPLEGDGVSMGEVGWTDSSGVVLTPEELADLRGDPAAAITGPQPEQVVVVYEGGRRMLWPDEYEDAAEYHPAVGDQNYEGEFVTEVLDAITGESLSAPLATGLAAVSADDYDAAVLKAVTDGEPPADMDDTDAIPDLPTADDVRFVGVAIKALADNLEDVTDAATLRRIRNAEAQTTKRAGALKAIDARLERVAGGVVLRLAK